MPAADVSARAHGAGAVPRCVLRLTEQRADRFSNEAKNQRDDDHEEAYESDHHQQWNQKECQSAVSHQQVSSHAARRNSRPAENAE